MKTIYIHKKIKVTNQQIDDIMTTAFEGGINYWCGEARRLKNPELKSEDKDVFLSQLISRGYSVMLYDDTGVSVGYINIKKLKSGLTLWFQNHKNANLEDFDADDADVIVQYAVFGQLVYG